MNDDARFLEGCGIEVDRQWIMEIVLKEAPPQASNYFRDLARISQMSGPYS
jgi:hypothetical protein